MEQGRNFLEKGNKEGWFLEGEGKRKEKRERKLGSKENGEGKVNKVNFQEMAVGNFRVVVF